MKFGEAIELAKQGKRVYRESWNGKGQFVYFQPGSEIKIRDLRCKSIHDWAERVYMLGDDGVIKINDHFDMLNARSEIVVGWAATQTDMLSEDWTVLDD